MFVYEYLSFQDSTEFCKNQGYQLAKIKIKHGNVDDNKLENFSVYSGVFFWLRVGLKFLNENGTWSGKWVDGENYDEASSGDIKLYKDVYRIKNCHEVVVDMRNMKSIFKTLCGNRYFFLCRKQENFESVSKTTD